MRAYGVCNGNEKSLHEKFGDFLFIPIKVKMLHGQRAKKKNNARPKNKTIDERKKKFGRASFILYKKR